MIKFTHTYQDIICVENLILAWKEFRNGKRLRKDVLIFEHNLMGNILQLFKDLEQRSYRHSEYSVFKISDPKPRVIHKADIKDRLLHHALHRQLYPFFDRKFIADSYSCRIDKGSHAALNRFCKFIFKASKNNTKTAWVLKCDIKKFFASIDHKLLNTFFVSSILDEDIIWLLSEVVSSFELNAGKGLPLGNLTSQLFANIYMDRFDRYIKYILKVKFYIRYADDFVFVSDNKDYLLRILPEVREFLKEKLFLDLHKDKILLRTVASGIDFLGWVHFRDHRVLRTVTRRRMFRNIMCSGGNENTVRSYLGLISHGNTFKLKQEIERIVVYGSDSISRNPMHGA